MPNMNDSIGEQNVVDKRLPENNRKYDDEKRQEKESAEENEPTDQSECDDEERDVEDEEYEMDEEDEVSDEDQYEESEVDDEENLEIKATEFAEFDFNYKGVYIKRVRMSCFQQRRAIFLTREALKEYSKEQFEDIAKYLEMKFGEDCKQWECLVKKRESVLVDECCYGKKSSLAKDPNRYIDFDIDDLSIYLCSTETKNEEMKVGKEDVFVKRVNMPVEMQKKVIGLTKEAMEKCNRSSTEYFDAVSDYITNGMNREFGSKWICIIDAHFSRFIGSIKEIPDLTKSYFCCYIQYVIDEANISLTMY